MRCRGVKPGGQPSEKGSEMPVSQRLGEEHCQAVRRVTAAGSRRGCFWVPLVVGSYMRIANLSIIARACLCAVILATAACAPRRIPPMTVTDLMEDRVTLDGVLMKCNQYQTKARTDSDCLNARIAIERLASQTDPAVEAKRTEDFERSREQLRVSQDKLRQEQEAKTKVDAYHLPLVPVEPTPAPAPNDTKPPSLGRTNP